MVTFLEVQLSVQSKSGNYVQGENQVWTLDIPSLTYNITAYYGDNDGFWSLDITPKMQEGAQKCSFAVILENIYSCSSQPMNENFTFCSNVTCTMSGNVAEVTINLFELGTDDNNSWIEVKTYYADMSQSYKEDIFLFLQECAQVANSSENVIVHKLSDKANYKSLGNCSCSIQNAVPYDVMNQNTHTVKGECNEVTQWDGCQNIQCWFAPIPIVNVTSNQPIDLGNYTYVTGDTIFINCSGNPGYPKVNKFEPIFNDSIQSESLVLQPIHNKLEVMCQGTNNFTSLIDGSPVYSLPITLIVLFPPYNSSLSETFVQEASIGSSVIITYLFSANPLLGKGNISMNFTDFLHNDNDVLNASTGGLERVGQQLQAYNYRIPNVTAKSFGNYTMTAISSEPYFVNKPLIMTIALKEMKVDHSENGPNTWLIIGCAVVGSLIVILVLVLVITCIRKKRVSNRRKDNDVRSTPETYQKEERINPIYGSARSDQKEDRINPLYGTTSAETDNATYTTVVKSKGKKREKTGKSAKEEKINPLYNPSTVNDNSVEEAYAAVEKRKKKGGNENPVFAVDSSGDTYTEVIKKKKKKPVPTEPDVMYAEVQKQKKKKAGVGIDGNLHGS